MTDKEESASLKGGLTWGVSISPYRGKKGGDERES